MPAPVSPRRRNIIFSYLLGPGESYLSSPDSLANSPAHTSQEGKAEALPTLHLDLRGCTPQIEHHQGSSKIELQTANIHRAGQKTSLGATSTRQELQRTLAPMEQATMDPYPS